MRPILAFLLLAASAWADDDGFKPLVRGTDPTQFELVGIGPDALSIVEGEVRVSGKPNGYFATKESYKDYVFQYEWKYERPEGGKPGDDSQCNSGLLVHIQGPPKVWPTSIEFQLLNREVGKIYPIAGAKFENTWDAEAAQKATKPVGEWNRQEVTSKGGAMSCTLNGVAITEGTGATPDHGQIGFQSEGSAIRLRGLRIKPLD